MPTSSEIERFFPDTTHRKAKRLYQRMATGLQIAKNQDQPMRFMTLTTSNKRVPDKNGNVRTSRKSFEILRKRIERATIRRDKFQGFKLNKYYCLRTAEGNGVLHIIFWGGRFIPRKWLKENWEEIHGAYMVDIRFIHKIRQKVGGIVGYLLDRYLLNQPIERMSYGWGWAWLGFCKSWQNVKDKYGMLRRGKGQFRQQQNIEHSNLGEHPEFIVSFNDKFDFKQAVPAWKSVLWEHPVTSRQTKFYYPSRGYSRKYFKVIDQPFSESSVKKQIAGKNEVSSLRVGDFESVSDYANALLKNKGGVTW